jgi:hypothetical protein
MRRWGRSQSGAGFPAHQQGWMAAHNRGVYFREEEKRRGRNPYLANPAHSVLDLKQSYGSSENAIHYLKGSW